MLIRAYPHPILMIREQAKYLLFFSIIFQSATIPRPMRNVTQNGMAFPKLNESFGWMVGKPSRPMEGELEMEKDETVLKVEETKKLRVRDSWPAWLLIGAGVILLLAQLFDVSLMTFFWPAFVIAPGLLLMWPAANMTAERMHPLAFLAVPGAIITSTGLLLFAMNITNHFEAWAYSWPLVAAAVAGSLMYIKRFDPEDGVHQGGQNFVRVMVIAFMVLAVFFELVVFATVNLPLSVVLIAAGIFLLARGRRETAVA